MQSEAPDVTVYLQEVPQNRQAVLGELRRLCLETLQGYEEGMDYGMPSYKKNGVVEVGFASQKNYISLYILKQHVVEMNKPLLAGLNVGKGCIRYTTPAKLKLDVVEKLLLDTMTSGDAAC